MADEKHPIPVGPGERAEPIRITHTTLRSMADKGPAYIRMTAEAAGHMDRRYLPTMHTGEEADLVLMGARGHSNASDVTRSKAVKEIFARGSLVYDNRTGRKCTILHLNAARTKKGNICHEVGDLNGNTWLARAKDLQSR